MERHLRGLRRSCLCRVDPLRRVRSGRHADDGTAGDRRAFHFPPGAPDGMAVDAQGLLWVASARAGCVARLTPDGEIDRVLAVPAQTVTSLCFAGGDQHDLYVVTADNTDVPDRRG